MECVEIDGVRFVKESNTAIRKDDMEFCIVRTYSAGVFAGYIKKRVGKEVEMVDARRFWYWEGAASLSQLAMEGVKNPDKCKFPCEVLSTKLTEVIEIIPCTEAGKKSINQVPVWES